MSLEHLFSTSVLGLSVPNASVQFPPSDPPDEWLETLTSNSQERKQAFFDEQLQSLLTLRVEHPTPDEPADPSRPSSALVSFLAHVQISLEASYISSVPTLADTPNPTRLSAPPRTASLTLKSSARGGAHHPSILPPHTPNPTPATGDQDRKYVSSQGTLLLHNIWGQNSGDDAHEEFALVWSEKEGLWIAVYRLSLTVSFLRLSFADPLLCLTISATLREKPVTTSSIQHPLIRALKAFDSVVLPESPHVVDKTQAQDDENTLDGFEEVNLLEGLHAGPTFSRVASEINLPSTRLGTVSRQKLFSLPPINLPTPTVSSPSPSSATRGKTHPTLRKSYRKTLETVSGFRVRMRTVFVPSVVLDASQQDHDKMTSGNEERTVVLCVEIENSGESGQGIGFEVEKVDVSISGDEAKATLITWGHEKFTGQDNTFPLQIAQWAQYNLLYAVSFLRSPEELDAFSFARKAVNTANTDLQRAVSINIHGKPYVKSSSSSSIIYPTRTFSSRWNCILDLSSQQTQTQNASLRNNIDPLDPSAAHPSVLPEPPSPFPVLGLQTSKPSPTTPSNVATTIVGDTAKSSQLLAGRIVKSPRPRSPLSVRPSRMSLPAQVPGQYSRSPGTTTYSAPTQPDSSHPQQYPGLPPSRTHTPPTYDSPVTPAYPAFSPRSSVALGIAAPPTHAPVVSQTSVGIIGPTLEARRGRGSGLMQAIGGILEPPTPVPYTQSQHQQNFDQFAANTVAFPSSAKGDTVVISVGLSNVIQSGGIGAESRRRKAQSSEEEEEEDTDESEDLESEPSSSSEQELELGPGKIYPLDTFTLDIFVFNQSERTRRFEISCFERKRRRRAGAAEINDSIGISGGGAKKMGYPGFMPMESQVRIGPLLPSACQSVRMDFLAVSPGVHSIEALTLTDIESGYSVNLQSVMDIVIHRPDD